MIKDVIQFDTADIMYTIGNFSWSESDGLKNYLERCDVVGIIEQCAKKYELSQIENYFHSYVKGMFDYENETQEQYEEYVSQLQQFGANLLSEGSVWMPITYTIMAEMLYCCYMDMIGMFGDSRDCNLDMYSAKQVRATLPIILQEILVKEKTIIASAIRKEIKTGYIDVAEVFIFIRKYYYVDLNGKKYSNYNSEAQRDKAVNDYINKLYGTFSEYGTGMMKKFELFRKSLSDYSVYN